MPIARTALPRVILTARQEAVLGLEVSLVIRLGAPESRDASGDQRMEMVQHLGNRDVLLRLILEVGLQRLIVERRVQRLEKPLKRGGVGQRYDEIVTKAGKVVAAPLATARVAGESGTASVTPFAN